jgi:DNA ligase 1
VERFAALLEQLLLTPQRNAKLALLIGWLSDTPDPERGWGLAAITGGLSFKNAKAGVIRGLIEGKVDAELFRLSYDFVGDLAETVALLWPTTPGANRAPDLSDVIEGLATTPRHQMARRLSTWLDGLDSTGRWALLKLITGGLRIGVSGRLARQAVADFGGVDVSAVEEVWHAQSAPYFALFDWLEGRSDGPPARQAGAFRPVMLAHPLDMNSLSLIAPQTHQAEWKWDGIRVQVVSEGGVKRLYTRTGEDISATFPDVIGAIDFEAVIDGELLVRAADGSVAGFNDLQQRLNRKTIDAKRLAAFPAFVRAYDLLATPDRDLRDAPLIERRVALQSLIHGLGEAFDLSEAIVFDGPETLTALRDGSSDPRAEGLMLKRLDSPYLAGRVTGHWWKWKREPMRADCVLIYAQRGHGKRSSLYSDFTFAAWTEDPGVEGRTLVPVGKAYFGFTDAELKELDKFVRENTIERFGPVRSVRADEHFGLVLEVAFEGLARSTRHKSGLAMRFPRIARIRWDKPARDAETVTTLAAFLSER